MAKLRTVRTMIWMCAFVCLLQMMTLLYTEFDARTCMVLHSTEHKTLDVKSLQIFPTFQIDTLKPDWTEDVVLLGDKDSLNTMRNLTMGIVTAQRRNDTVYLFQTLDSLLNHSDARDQQEFRIVILLADDNATWKQRMIETFLNKYKDELSNGLLYVLQSFGWIYPRLKNLKKLYPFHTDDQVRWIAKQNIDFAFLWLYVNKLNISSYYLHLEDDLITVDGYVQLMKDYIREQTDHWTCLEFSKLGMIAKLYRTRDLETLAKLVTLFYEGQPADVIYLTFNDLRQQLERRIRKPTLFQHTGVQSSLKKKMHERRDIFFLGDLRKDTVRNPPATFFTNLSFLKEYFPEKAYDSPFHFYMWTNMNLSKGDFLDVILQSKQRVRHVEILTGNTKRPNDILQNGCLQYSADDVTKSGSCENYKHIADFKSGSIDVQIPPYFPEIKCLRILVKSDQNYWLIIDKIYIET